MLKINRDLEASFGAIGQINQNTFSYYIDLGKCMQKMISSVPNISIKINNIFSELSNNIDEINKILQPFFEINHSLQQNLQELLSQMNIDKVLKNKESIEAIEKMHRNFVLK